MYFVKKIARHEISPEVERPTFQHLTTQFIAREKIASKIAAGYRNSRDFGQERASIRRAGSVETSSRLSPFKRGRCRPQMANQMRR